MFGRFLALASTSAQMALISISIILLFSSLSDHLNVALYACGYANKVSILVNLSQGRIAQLSRPFIFHIYNLPLFSMPFKLNQTEVLYERFSLPPDGFYPKC